MIPIFVQENVQTVSSILFDNNLGHFIDNLSDPGIIRGAIRTKQAELASEKKKISRELLWVYNLYPSNGQLFRASAGISKRMYNKALALISNIPGADIAKGIEAIKAERKERKKSELKARQEKHKIKKAARAGKVRTKHVVVKKESK